MLDRLIYAYRKKKIMLGFQYALPFAASSIFRAMVSHILPGKIQLFNGRELNIVHGDKGISVDLYLGGIREPFATLLLKGEFSRTRPHGVFLDLGANIGYYPSVLGEYFDKVVAVEVNDSIIPVLRKNLPRNSTVIPGAVVPQKGSDYFFTGKGETNLGTVSGSSSGGSLRVARKIELDYLLSRYRPNFVKTDIEGFEYDLILGSRFKYPPKYLFVEIHLGLKPEPETLAVFAKLHKLGYGIRYAIDEPKALETKLMFWRKRKALIIENTSIPQFLSGNRPLLSSSTEGVMEFIFIRKSQAKKGK
jgi:FkbM family methyltransferase